MQTNKGIGIFAVIVIIALLTIGGTAIYKISTSDKVDINVEEEDKEMKNESFEAKEVAKAKLIEIKSNLDLEGDLTATLNALSQIKTDLSNAYVSASSETKADVKILADKIDELRVKIETKAENIKDSFDDVINSIDLSIEADSEMDINEGSMEDQNMEKDNSDDSMMDENPKMEETESENTTEVEVDANASSEVNI